MITKITLHSFGRFQQTSFSFGKTTIFIGPNESGKTTIFDALALSLCQKKGRGRLWEAIQNRYKTQNETPPSIQIETSQPFALDYNQFFNFFAIRASESRIEFGDNRNWVSEMRSRLLFGGYDISNLTQRFRDLVTSNQAEGYRRRIDALRREISQLSQEQEKWGQQAKSYQETLETYQDHKIRLENTQVLFQTKQKERDSLQEQLIQIEKALEATEIHHWLRLYQDYSFLVDEIQRRFSGLSETEIKEIERLFTEFREKREKIQHQETETKQRLLEYEKLRLQIQAIHQEKEKTQELHQKKKKKIITWIAAGSGLALFSIVNLGMMVVLPIVPWYVWLGISVLALMVASMCFIVGVLLSQQSLQTPLSQTIEHLYHKAQEQGFLSLRPQSWEAFESEFAKQETILNSRLREIEEEKKHLAEQEKNIKKREEDFLTFSRVASLAAAKQLLEEKKAKEATLQGLVHALNTHRLREAPLSLEDNARKLQDKLSLISHQGEEDTHHLTVRQNEIRQSLSRLEKDLDTLRQEIATLQQEEASLSARLLLLEEAMTQYATIYQQRQHLHIKLTNLEKEKAACELLLHLFEEIEKEQSRVFETLSQQVREEFGSIYTSLRDIQLTDFTTEGIFFPDVLGQIRPIEYLSKGTQDLFYLALRLFLGRKMWTNTEIPGIFLLDEPFASLDKERQEVALNILRTFQSRYKWQYIIFTKDDTLPSLLEKQGWSDVVVHTLQR